MVQRNNDDDNDDDNNDDDKRVAHEQGRGGSINDAQGRSRCSCVENGQFNRIKADQRKHIQSHIQSHKGKERKGKERKGDQRFFSFSSNRSRKLEEAI